MLRRLVITFSVTATMMTGCQSLLVDEPLPKIDIIGHEGNREVFDAFFATMEDLGYTDGENIIYVRMIGPAPADFLISGSGAEGAAPDVPPQDGEQAGAPAEVGRAVFSEDAAIILTAGGRQFAEAQLERPADTVIVATILPEATQGQPDNPDSSEQGRVGNTDNFTGITEPPVVVERFRLLLEVYPTTDTVYIPVLAGEREPSALREIEAIAEQAGVDVVVAAVDDPEGVETAINAMSPAVDAIFTAGNSILLPEAWEQAAIDRSIPFFIVGGGQPTPFVYDVDRTYQGQRAAELVHRLLQGENVDDIPIESGPARLTVNLLIAEEQGVVIPDRVLEQADEIIGE